MTGGARDPGHLGEQGPPDIWEAIARPDDHRATVLFSPAADHLADLEVSRGQPERKVANRHRAAAAASS